MGKMKKIVVKKREYLAVTGKKLYLRVSVVMNCI